MVISQFFRISRNIIQNSGYAEKSESGRRKGFGNIIREHFHLPFLF
ncbi:Uncharacterized protein dnm_091740 [Desulfonema magnum]|uniref:Uncharacterized protein n=1 Tax=Desulfonema magnum TaxID=45655 RepID=A0A975BX04_9BACT|nr:Uncharacterized protein dnm_018410 [Desulfonema magnum]QTA89950.1 Uncharacterized protein dnm_060090 [Desulfonema magnum]QTA90602.1 Uncharacterized protein dnm_066630 [Desulfonema magnum]QTA93077.1 Uncharacterized protein dnm_091740 [Desulfonema magnum]